MSFNKTITNRYSNNTQALMIKRLQYYSEHGL
jgi:hypothetical protein